MAKEVFVMGTKFYLDNPFNGEQKDGAQRLPAMIGTLAK